MEIISNKLKIAMIITILIPILMLLLFLIGLSKVEAQTNLIYAQDMYLGFTSANGTQNYNSSGNIGNGAYFAVNTTIAPNTLAWRTTTTLDIQNLKMVLFNFKLEANNPNVTNKFKIYSIDFNNYPCYYNLQEPTYQIQGGTSPEETQESLYGSAMCIVDTNVTIPNNGHVAVITMSPQVILKNAYISHVELLKDLDITAIAQLLETNNTSMQVNNQNLVNIYLRLRDLIDTNIDNRNRIISTIDADITALINAITSQNTQITNAINGTTQAVEDMAEEDIDSNTKQPVDNTNVNDYNTKESTLMNTATQTNLNDVSIGIDNTASGNIWQLITRILNTNAKVFGLVISILSIGIIKLMLAR